jgi:tetratricopeptide (TPR) repeat protein
MSLSKEERIKLINDIKDSDIKYGLIGNRDFSCSDSVLKQVHFALYDEIPSDKEIEKLPNYIIQDYIKRFQYENKFDKALKFTTMNNVYDNPSCDKYYDIMRIYLKAGNIELALKLSEETDAYECYWELAAYYQRNGDFKKSCKYFKKCKAIRPLETLNNICDKKILDEINEDIETGYDKYMKYRKVENELEKMISTKHLRFIILEYIVMY